MLGLSFYWALTVVLLASFSVCTVLVFTQHWHGPFSLDHDLKSTQKIHKRPVPRIGGVGLALGIGFGVGATYWLGGKSNYWTDAVLLCASLPVFFAGLWEDLSKRVSVRARLYASFLSAALAIWMTNAYLNRLDTFVLDDWMAFRPFAILFTCFAIAGVTHATNIIDGLNGLASGTVVIMLFGLAGIAWQVGDEQVLRLCLWGAAAMLGFMLLNFPFGRIFLGDGGAYLAGFWVAQCAVLLLARNGSVSTWAVLLTCVYPVLETVHSMYRRKMRSRVGTGQADAKHLHHALYGAISHSIDAPQWFKHGYASVILWSVSILCAVLAQFSFENTREASICVGVVAIGFLMLHGALTARARSELVQSSS